MGENEMMGGGGEGMQCVDHPYRSSPGGICAICLQEKLGKLVSVSKSTPFSHDAAASAYSPPSSSSFRSDAAARGRSKLPFLDAGKKAAASAAVAAAGSGSAAGVGGGRKVPASSSTTTTTTTSSSSSSSANMGGGGGNGIMALKRSKSVAPRPLGGLAEATMDSPRKKSFWSFLHLSSTSSTAAAAPSSVSGKRRSTSSYSSVGEQQQKQEEEEVVESPGGGGGGPGGNQRTASMGRKVSRSRSVGCGSRSFSGDFLERISTGLGDCALRRVESQREAKRADHKVTVLDHHHHHNADHHNHRVKCGGLFGGFGGIISSSSSSYWISAAADGFDGATAAGRMSVSGPGVRAGTPRGRRSWAWASTLASPMRAFRPTAPSSTTADAAVGGKVNGSASGGGGGEMASKPAMLAVGS